jgi:hypothetical protein
MLKNSSGGTGIRCANLAEQLISQKASSALTEPKYSHITARTSSYILERGRQDKAKQEKE